MQKLLDYCSPAPASANLKKIGISLRSGLDGYGSAIISSKINPTDSVIPTFSVGLSKGRGWSKRSITGIDFLRPFLYTYTMKFLCAVSYHLTDEE